MSTEIKKQLVTYCDFCEREIEPVEKRCGECYQVIEMTPIYRTRVWDTRKLFPDLCENCARKLDRTLQFMQDGMVRREELMRRNAELNKIRRAELGTNG